MARRDDAKLTPDITRDVCPTCGHTIRASRVGESVFSRALFEKRNRLKLTIRQAAEVAKVTTATYYRAEAGRMPDVSTAVTLAAWLEKSLDALFMASARRPTAPPRP